MVDVVPAPNETEVPALKGEIARLNKVVRALMDRAERNASVQTSEFGLFQTAVILEEQVRRRTAELEAALHENEKITRALRESEAKFRGLVTQSMVGIVTIEAGKFSYSNAKFDEIFGYTAEEVQGLNVIEVAIDEDRPMVAENLRRRISGEIDHVQYVFRGRRKDGRQIDVEVQGGAMDVAGRRVLISLVMDVTERTRAEREVQALQERLREQSTRDSLTGLYNRRYLEEALARELVAAGRNGQPVTVILADLDHFKAVNDRFGHLAGDEVLRVFGEMMRSRARSTDIYCRYGGEEFLLVLPQMPPEVAVERTEELRATLARNPISHEAGRIAVTASFGIATFPHDGLTAEELIAAADSALYGAKAAGRNRVCIAKRDYRGVVASLWRQAAD